MLGDRVRSTPSVFRTNLHGPSRSRAPLIPRPPPGFNASAPMRVPSTAPIHGARYDFTYYPKGSFHLVELPIRDVDTCVKVQSPPSHSQWLLLAQNLPRRAARRATHRSLHSTLYWQLSGMFSRSLIETTDTQDAPPHIGHTSQTPHEPRARAQVADPLDEVGDSDFTEECSSTICPDSHCNYLKVQLRSAGTRCNPTCVGTLFRAEVLFPAHRFCRHRPVSVTCQ